MSNVMYYSTMTQPKDLALKSIEIEIEPELRILESVKVTVPCQSCRQNMLFTSNTHKIA